MGTLEVLIRRSCGTRMHHSFWQAKQIHVFYLDDTKFGNPWKVVRTFSHRHVFDVPEINEDTDDTNKQLHVAYQEDNTSHIIVKEVVIQDIDVDDEFHAEEGELVDARLVEELERQVDNDTEALDMSEDEEPVDMSDDDKDDMNDDESDVD